MKCKNTQKKLIFFYYKELTASENEQIKNHLQECEKCNIAFLNLKQSLSFIETEKNIQVNPFIYTRIQQKINKIENKEQITEPQFIKKRIFQPIMITLVISIGITLGIFIGNFYQSNNKITNTDNEIATEEFYLNDFQQEPYLSYLMDEN